jgi:hypothetical protein
MLLSSYCNGVQWPSYSPTPLAQKGIAATILDNAMRYIKCILYPRSQTFAVFWMLYAFFWLILRRLNFICRRFGTLCPIFIPIPLWRRNRQCSETSAYKIQTPRNYPEESIEQFLISLHIVHNYLISEQRTITQSKLRGTIERSNTNTWITVSYQGSTTGKLDHVPLSHITFLLLPPMDRFGILTSKGNLIGPM